MESCLLWVCEWNLNVVKQESLYCRFLPIQLLENLYVRHLWKLHFLQVPLWNSGVRPSSSSNVINWCVSLLIILAICQFTMLLLLQLWFYLLFWFCNQDCYWFCVREGLCAWFLLQGTNPWDLFWITNTATSKCEDKVKETFVVTDAKWYPVLVIGLWPISVLTLFYINHPTAPCSDNL